MILKYLCQQMLQIFLGYFKSRTYHDDIVQKSEKERDRAPFS